MYITFFSNFLNHHQTPFCDAIYKVLNGNFTFVSTEKTPDEFIQNGYPDCSNYSYNLNSYSNEFNHKKAIKLGIDSDIVIIGSSRDIYIKERINQNKVTFRYSERILKKSIYQLINPRFIRAILKTHTIHRKKNMYMLCASAYAVNDFNMIFAYPKKMFKWGYFTRVEEFNIQQTIHQRSNERIEILWTGRFLKWKHPELAILLAKELVEKQYDFQLNMIGTGEKYNYIKSLINKLELSDRVSLLGNMPNDDVREHMKKSHIFLYTSDRNEGWGAVLNEAMGSGCAVISSHSIGSVPFIINHHYNGLIFKSGCLEDLLLQTEKILKNKPLRDELCLNAYYTLKNEWSPEIATTNFMLLAKSILNKNQINIESGPCSIAFKTEPNFWH
jgi:glycosyltransferase involved in cell wall biosynthesis